MAKSRFSQGLDEWTKTLFKPLQFAVGNFACSIRQQIVENEEMDNILESAPRSGIGYRLFLFHAKLQIDVVRVKG